MQQAPYILFDGKCHFCIAVVRFVINRDKGLFRVLPVQEAGARKILREYGIRVVDLNTVYLVEEGKVYVRSRAAFRIFELLGGVYGMISKFKFLPVGLTDAVYKFIARNRFTFGRSDDKIEELRGDFPKRFVYPSVSENSDL